MTRMLLIVAGAAVLAASGALAQGQKRIDSLTTDSFQLDSAAKLVEICTLDADHPGYGTAKGFCYGYISGGGHFHRALSQGPTYDPMICPPPDVTHKQVVEVFTSYMRENPQRRGEPAMDVLFRATVAEWPCA